MISKKLGKGTDFDLAIYNAQTNEEYVDDSDVIQRNTSVLVARRPAFKPGKGTAQRYLNMTMATTQKQPIKNIYTKPMVAVRPKMGGGENQSESDAISLMFQQQSEQWQQTQDQMATVRPIYRPPMPGRGGAVGGGAGRGMMGGGYRPMGGMDMEPQRPPPPGYTCFRCGEKGHFINMCPTLGNKEFDNKPKIKRATGIPTMFLKTIQNKEGVDRGLMVTQEGDLVVAMPNDDGWKKMNLMNQNFRSIGDAYETAPIPPSLSCFICKKLLREAVTSPCCQTHYCETCIQHELLEPDDIHTRLKCPKCMARLVPDQLIVNKEIRLAVDTHLRNHAKGKREASPVREGDVDEFGREIRKSGEDDGRKRSGDDSLDHDRKRYR
ncbi:hypothetical protein BC833DRAFT_652013 [Globomyces pollinis-pini]|nr:hypothetical protein BC833DRAFT_652013 [Globomyces pollinis-pini]